MTDRVRPGRANGTIRRSACISARRAFRVVCAGVVPCVVLASVLLAGCAPRGSVRGAAVDALDPDAATVRFASEDYPAVFDATRAALGEMRFLLDRVDAARGVITTYPKPTAGLATPWDREQSTVREDGQDLAHQHERVCRVVFEPEGAPVAARVEVAVRRVRRPGWRIETDAIRLSTHAVDPVARRNGSEPEFRETVRMDPALGARLAERIEALARTEN